MSRVAVGLFKRSSSWKTKSGKTKSNWSWWARWREEVGYEEDDLGRRRPKYRDRQASLKTQDRQLARRMAVELEDRLSAPARPARGRVLDWETALDLYESYLGPGLQPLTLQRRVQCWRAFWTWASVGPGAVTELDALTQERVLQWRAWATSDRTPPLRHVTVNAYLAACQTVVRKLRKLRLYAGENAFQDIDRLAEATPRKSWLSSEEVEVVLHTARESEDLYLFCALMVYLGLRPGEALAARWDWVHFSDGGGHVQVPLGDEQWRVKDKEARAIPLAPALAEILHAHRGVGRAYIVAPRCTEWRIDIRRRWPYWWRFLPIRTCLEGRKISPYTLRRTFASQCAQLGIPEYKVMRWMGHSDIKMLQVYAHLRPDDRDICRLFPDVAPGADSR